MEIVVRAISEYDYWQKLIEGIELYTKLKTKKNKEFFFSEGVNYIVAFERDAYYSIFGNSEYYPQLQASLKDGVIMYVGNNTHKEIFLLMFSTLRVKVKKTFKYRVQEFIYINRSSTLWLREKLAKKYTEYFQSSHLFISIHHKFIRNFSLFFQKFDNSVFIICDDLEESIKVCESNNYQYIVLRAKSKLFNNFNKTVWALCCRYGHIKYLLDIVQPEFIFFLEGDAPIYELFNLAARQEGNIKTVCLQQGWSPVIHNGFRKMHYDLFLTWSRVFTDILQKYNPDQKFIDVGSYILNSKDEEKNGEAITFFYQRVGGFISKKMADSLIDFLLFCADKYPDQLFIVRDHPQISMDDVTMGKILKYDNIKVKNADKYLLPDVLLESKIAISLYSSTLYEAISCNVIPFAFNLTGLPKFNPGFDQKGIGIEVDNFQDAIVKIDKLINNGEYYINIQNNIISFKSQYFKNIGNDAITNIIQAIENL
jgi:hypothetical protein